MKVNLDRAKIIGRSGPTYEVCIPQKSPQNMNDDFSNKQTVPQMLTIRETAARTGLSYDFIRKLCLQRRIVFVRSGSKFLINFDKLIDYLNRGEQSEGTQLS